MAGGISDPTAGLYLRGAYLHLGVSAVREADSGTIEVGGAAVPGAAYATNTMFAPSIEGGYVLPSGFGASVFATSPVTTPNIAGGSLAGYGDLGDETNAFFAVTAHYHLALSDWLSPYFGGGWGYMQALGTRDGVIGDFKVNSASGGVLQAGMDVKLRRDAGLFVDVKRYFLSGTASGTLGPDPAAAQARIDPWIVSTGLTLNF